MSSERPRTRRSYLQTAGLVGVGTLTGCIGGGGGDAGPPIPVGSLLPTTGELSAHGSDMQDAVNLAVEHANDAGGPLNRGIELVNKDSGSESSTALEQYDALVGDDEIVGFVGAVSSEASVALAQRIPDDEVMQVSPASAAATLSGLGYGEDDWPKYFARTAPGDTQEALVMGRTLGRNEYVGADTAAFLYVDGPYGAGVAEKASQAFDGETTAMVGYSRGTTDYSQTLDQVFTDDPDGVGLVGYPGTGQTILEQWSEGDYGGQWVLGTQLTSPELFANAPDAVSGAYVASPDPGSEDTRGHERFAEAMDDADTPFAAHAYDAMFLQALAIQKATTDAGGGPPKEASGRAIAQFIREVSRPNDGDVTVTVGQFQKAKQAFARDNSINYEGASGPVDLSQSLDTRNRFAILRVESDGSTSTVERLPRSFFEGKL